MVRTQMLKVKNFTYSLSLSLSLSTTNLQHLIATTHHSLLLTISPFSLLVASLSHLLFVSPSCPLSIWLFGFLDHGFRGFRFVDHGFSGFGLKVVDVGCGVDGLWMVVVVTLVVGGGDWVAVVILGFVGFFFGLSCSGFGWVSLVLVWNFHSIVMVVVVGSCGG